jgi:hypothetical protein
MARNVPGLKALVIVMGALIVAGLAVLAVTVARRAGEADFGIGEGYATGAIALPDGARVIGMTGEGDAVTLLVDGLDGTQSLITIDRRTGEHLGTLELGPGR